MKSILITGAQGFIGQNLKAALENEVEIFEINEDIFRDNQWAKILTNRLEAIKPGAVFHVGACADTMEQDVNHMMTRNFESTKIIADYCAARQIPLIYSSSAAVYGANGLYPSNLYGWSKYVAEQYVTQKGGIALRYFNVYGPHESHKGRMASVAHQVWVKRMKGESIKLFPHKPQRDFVYVQDVVDANIYAYTWYNQLPKIAFEVGSGVARTFEEVLQIMGITFGYDDETHIPKGYQFYTCSDATKWMPGWKPQYNLEAGLGEYLQFLSQTTEFLSTD